MRELRRRRGGVTWHSLGRQTLCHGTFAVFCRKIAGEIQSNPKSLKSHVFILITNSAGASTENGTLFGCISKEDGFKN
jgi:hypothetical protein